MQISESIFSVVCCVVNLYALLAMLIYGFIEYSNLRCMLRAFRLNVIVLLQNYPFTLGRRQGMPTPAGCSSPLRQLKAVELGFY